MAGKESLEQQNLPAVEKAARAKEVDAYIEKNREVKAMLKAKHPEYKEAVTSGNFVRANAVKNEINTEINKETEKYADLTSKDSSSPSSNKAYRWPRPWTTVYQYQYRSSRVAMSKLVTGEGL